MPEIDALLEELSKDQGFEQKLYPVTSNWASILAHDCERYLFHNRRDWERRLPRDWKGIGERGNLIHSWWKQRMMAKGYEVIQGEMPLSQALRATYTIGGKIDGRIGKGNTRPLLYEFKTMSEHEYGKINTLDDIRASSKHYIRSYVGQLMLYLYDNKEDTGLFILCNAVTLEWKWIVVQLDKAYVSSLLERAARVNAAYSEDAPPARIPYGPVCEACDYRHICLPDILNGKGIEFVDDPGYHALLDRRGELQAMAEEYAGLDADAKAKARAVGVDHVAGSWKVELNKHMRGDKEIVRVTIDPLAGPRE